MKPSFEPQKMLHSRRRLPTPAEHTKRWREALAWLKLRRRLWQVCAGIFIGSSVLAVFVRLFLPGCATAYPQVLEIETAVGFILLYFFVPELVAAASDGPPLLPLVTRVKQSLGHASAILKQALFMALLASGSVLPLVLVRPLGSTTLVQPVDQQPPAQWAAHFLTGEAAFFCYLLLAVVVAYVLLLIIGSSSWYRLVLVLFTVGTLPQATGLWEPAGFYIRAVNMDALRDALAPYGAENTIVGFHRFVANPPPFPDLSQLNPTLVALLLLMRRLLLTVIASYLLSVVAAVLEVLRPMARLRGIMVSAIRRQYLRHPRLLAHLLGSLAVIGLASIATIFLGGYAEASLGLRTAQPVAAFTLLLTAVIGYVVARSTAEYLREGRLSHPSIPTAALMRSQLSLTTCYALVLASWGGANLGVLVYLLGLSWVSLVAVMGLVIVSGALLVLAGLIMLGLSRIEVARRYSALATGLAAGAGLGLAAFLFYPPETPAALLETETASAHTLAPILNQLLLLESVNCPAAFNRWLSLSEFASRDPTMLGWLLGCILAVLLILGTLIWLVMRLSRRLA